MHARTLAVDSACLLLTALFTTGVLAAPPVNQSIGLRDVFFNEYTEEECILCHEARAPTPGAHHSTFLSIAGDCSACHGDFVDDFDDGHYVPSYEPTLVTPRPSEKPNGGLPLNSLGSPSGTCDYCHDDPDGTYTNVNLHHQVAGYSDCLSCHDFEASADESIRKCEDCHGPDSLHNIQTDSPNPANSGFIVVGGEDAGYGHVGRDAGPGDSDCWGCHGFTAVEEPTNNVDRHHNLYGDTIPAVSDAPFSTPGDIYVCLSCHIVGLAVERDCVVCHTAGVDSDSDGVLDDDDLCPGTVPGAADNFGCSDAQVDGDADGYCDPNAPSGGPSGCVGTDNCPTVFNPDQTDTNGDGYGDACVDPTVTVPDSADVSGAEISKGVIVGAGVRIGTGTTVDKDSSVGENTSIGNNTEVDKNSVIGADVTIGDDVSIAQGVTIDDDVQIGDRTIINRDAVIGAGAIIGSDCDIGRGATIEAGAVVPDGTVIGKNEIWHASP